PAVSALHPLSLHDALPIYLPLREDATGLLWRLLHRGDLDVAEALELGANRGEDDPVDVGLGPRRAVAYRRDGDVVAGVGDGLGRSEEHTSELQSRSDLVCR